MNTTIGERIAHTIVIVTIATVIHMPLTCVGHPQNLLLPLLHSLSFVFIVVVQIIGQWTAATALEIIERKVTHTQPSTKQIQQRETMKICGF